MVGLSTCMFISGHVILIDGCTGRGPTGCCRMTTYPKPRQEQICWTTGGTLKQYLHEYQASSLKNCQRDDTPVLLTMGCIHSIDWILVPAGQIYILQISKTSISVVYTSLAQSCLQPMNYEAMGCCWTQHELFPGNQGFASGRCTCMLCSKRLKTSSEWH